MALPFFFAPSQAVDTLPLAQLIKFTYKSMVCYGYVSILEAQSLLEEGIASFRFVVLDPHGQGLSGAHDNHQLPASGRGADELSC